MSDVITNNGTANRISGTPKNQLTTAYNKLRKLSDTGSVTVSGKTDDGTISLTVDALPRLTRDAIIKAGKHGAKWSIGLKDKIDGKKVTANGKGEGEEGVQIAETVFAVKVEEKELANDD